MIFVSNIKRAVRKKKRRRRKTKRRHLRWEFKSYFFLIVWSGRQHFKYKHWNKWKDNSVYWVALLGCSCRRKAMWRQRAFIIFRFFTCICCLHQLSFFFFFPKLRRKKWKSRELFISKLAYMTVELLRWSFRWSVQAKVMLRGELKYTL